MRRNYGAIIVKNDEIIATGYTGAPRGRMNCSDLGVCTRTKLGIPKGQRYELCRSVHAEQNCIISAKRSDMIGSTMYISGFEADTVEIVENIESCEMCKRFILNAGIEHVVYRVKGCEGGCRYVDTSAWIHDDSSINGEYTYK